MWLGSKVEKKHAHFEILGRGAIYVSNVIRNQMVKTHPLISTPLYREELHILERQGRVGPG